MKLLKCIKNIASKINNFNNPIEKRIVGINELDVFATEIKINKTMTNSLKISSLLILT